MKQLRVVAAFGAMAALGLAAAPAVAQDTPATNSAAEVVGPPQLSNFSLNGTVTRQANPAPEPTAAPARPRPAQPSAQQPAATAGSNAARTTQPTQRSAESSAPAPVETARAAPQASAPAQSVTFELPPPTPAEQAPVAAGFARTNPVIPEPVDTGAAGLSIPGGMPSLPWLLAAVAAAAAGLWFLFGRQRNRYALAGGMAFDSAPEPAPPAPAPAPQPLKRSIPADSGISSSGAIVSTRLRPWLDLELTPGRAILNDDGATIEFEVLVRNTGAAPARDILVEAAMFNAGPDQDEQIGAFFTHPETSGDRLPQLMPLSSVSMKSAVRLSLQQLRQFEIAGRKLFVPTLAVNALYRWSAGEGQTSSSYLVGRDTKGDKMAPLRLDMGARIFRGLGARPHSLAVRK